MNAIEAEFARKAAVDGWIVTKRGWPDFICRRGLEVMAVEVKDSDWLSSEQEATLKDLYVVGIKTFVWTKAGFQAFPAHPIDHMPSRLDLLREIDQLKDTIEKKDDVYAELRERFRLVNRLRRNYRDRLRGKGSDTMIERLERLAARVDKEE